MKHLPNDMHIWTFVGPEKEKEVQTNISSTRMLAINVFKTQQRERERNKRHRISFLAIFSVLCGFLSPAIHVSTWTFVACLVFFFSWIARCFLPCTIFLLLLSNPTNELVMTFVNALNFRLLSRLCAFHLPLARSLHLRRYPFVCTLKKAKHFYMCQRDQACCECLLWLSLRQLCVHTFAVLLQTRNTHEKNNEQRTTKKSKSLNLAFSHFFSHWLSTLAKVLVERILFLFELYMCCFFSSYFYPTLFQCN